MSLKSNIYESAVDTIGGVYGITYFKEILGIIVLVLTVINIIFKLGIMIYNKVKNKKISDIPDLIDDTIDKLEEFEDKIDENNRDL